MDPPIKDTFLIRIPKLKSNGPVITITQFLSKLHIW
eukprot:gene22113-8690_t